VLLSAAFTRFSGWPYGYAVVVDRPWTALGRYVLTMGNIWRRTQQ
jgi:hypothetical protein